MQQRGWCALLMLACACGSSRARDAAAPPEDAGADAGPRDAGARDATLPSADSGLPWLDGAPPDLICGTRSSTSCPIQAPATAHPCMGSGRVVFDGERCQLAEGSECGSDPGAFDSFVECALACEPEHCYAGAILYPPEYHDPSTGCPDAGFYATCTGLYVTTYALLEDCPALGPLDCAMETGASYWRCYDHPSETEEARRIRIRALSLLPFVRFVGCLAPD